MMVPTLSETPVKNWTRRPLENPLIYQYSFEGADDFVGTTNKPMSRLQQWHHQIELATLTGSVSSGQTVSISIL